jgi:hypothetical protein
VAGTGKSMVTQKIVEDAQNMRKEVAVAAPTGVAAVNLGPDLGAQTVHSLAGCGVPHAARDFAKMLSPWSIKKWKSIEVLVLDEIGMLNADYLGMKRIATNGIFETILDELRSISHHCGLLQTGWMCMFVKLVKNYSSRLVVSNSSSLEILHS